MIMITTPRGIDLHPMNYFSLAAAFFAFHLLLAYLLEHISIHAAFVICSAASIFLVESYLRLAIAIGSILTLFLVMQMTGRIRWSERLAARGTVGRTSAPSPSNL